MSDFKFSGRVPWVNPNRPLPRWLKEFTEVPEEQRTTLYTRNQLHARRYYLKLYVCTPRWETRARIASVYRRAEELRSRGCAVEVDHIVPLNNPIVCGLHTFSNLQILSTPENAKKSNNTFPDSPFEQSDLFGTELKQLELNL